MKYSALCDWHKFRPKKHNAVLTVGSQVKINKINVDITVKNIKEFGSQALSCQYLHKAVSQENVIYAFFGLATAWTVNIFYCPIYLYALSNSTVNTPGLTVNIFGLPIVYNFNPTPQKKKCTRRFIQLASMEKTRKAVKNIFCFCF